MNHDHYCSDCRYEHRRALAVARRRFTEPHPDVPFRLVRAAGFVALEWAARERRALMEARS